MANFRSLIAVLAAAAHFGLVKGSSTVNTYSKQYCLTQFAGTKTATVKSVTLAITIPLKQTITTTYTPSSTYTPSTSTTVSVVTAFTTSVTVSTPPVSTIAASAGFTPLASVAAADGFTNNYKRGISELRNRGVKHNARAAATTKECKAVVSGGKVVLSPTQYPKAVECLKVVEHVTVSTVTRTATTTVTITAATPITTSISTTTSTVISTSIAPAPSPVYAACQADNMLTHINGISIDGLGNFVTGLSGASASSAYDCCVQCVLAGSGCGGYAYLAGSCFFGTTTTCEGSATQNNALITFGSDDGDNVIAGNSNCGQFDISNF